MLEKGLENPIPLLLTAGGIVRFAEMARWRIGEVMALVDPGFATDDLESERWTSNEISHALGAGLFVRHGVGTQAELIVTDACIEVGRRSLFRLPASNAAEIYEAGRMLARRLSTSSKKWRSSESVSMNLSGSSDNRRQSLVGR